MALHKHTCSECTVRYLCDCDVAGEDLRTCERCIANPPDQKKGTL